jgi:hypothetical protein
MLHVWFTPGAPFSLLQSVVPPLRPRLRPKPSDARDDKPLTAHFGSDVFAWNSATDALPLRFEAAPLTAAAPNLSLGGEIFGRGWDAFCAWTREQRSPHWTLELREGGRWSREFLERRGYEFGCPRATIAL